MYFQVTYVAHILEFFTIRSIEACVCQSVDENDMAEYSDEDDGISLIYVRTFQRQIFAIVVNLF
jgi:hypothetical protein